MEEKVNTPEEDLVLACLHGDYLKAEKLLDTGVNPNCQGIFDTSPISAAVTHSRYDIIEMLLSRGADINIGSGQILEFTRTPLALACKNGDINMVKFLLDRGADINLRSGVYGSPNANTQPLGQPHGSRQCHRHNHQQRLLPRTFLEWLHPR